MKQLQGAKIQKNTNLKSNKMKQKIDFKEFVLIALWVIVMWAAILILN